MSNNQPSQLEYIPFQTLTKAKAYKILNYGRPYDKYTRFQISENPEQITDIYVDDEPYIKFAIGCESQITHQIEIHYSTESNRSMKSCILTNAEIDILVARYGCKL
jgi:uncharacterized protein YcsI (UPF0317 family)